MQKSMVPFTAQRSNLHLPPWKLVGQTPKSSRLRLGRMLWLHTQHKVMSVWFFPPSLLPARKKKKNLLCSYTDRTVQCRAWQSPLGTQAAFGKDDRTLKGHCSVQVSNLAATKALCGLCRAFHPSNIHSFSFLRTTTPSNVSIHSSEIEPQLLQTMNLQFLLNIAKEEQMEWVKQNSLGNAKYNTLIMIAPT